jgi:mannonate dehydratase
MRIALVVEPMSRQNLRLAAQIGVTDIVGRYPGPGLDSLQALKTRVEDAGLRLSVMEGYLPLPSIIRQDAHSHESVEEVIRVIRNMGRLGIPVLCYNFMWAGDLTRTSWDEPDRGGSRVNAFDDGKFDHTPDPASGRVPRSVLWDRLERFLERIVPAAEASGVTLAMHPDDPPLGEMRGIAHIMSRPRDFQRLVSLVPSPVNGICFCVGCFTEMGVDVPATIRRLGRHIQYVHYRNVAGCVPAFRETWVDCGRTNMVEAMRALREIGFNGPMRPDHVPKLEGESGSATGYTLLGRLYAVGYMKGVLQAIDAS